MRELDAQQVLWIRAFEEADGQGRLLTFEERAAATRWALEQAGPGGFPAGGERQIAAPPDELVSRRAVRLWEELQRRRPGLGPLLRTTRIGVGWGSYLFAIAFGLGLLSDALGPRRHINLLSFPLLGLLAWNLLAYLSMLVWPLLRARAATRTQGRSGGAGRSLVSWLAGLLLRARQRAFAAGDVSLADDGEAGLLRRTVARFLPLWRSTFLRLAEARVRRALHLAAIGMIAGVVGGMYLRGLVFEYRATWESTLLDAAHVQALLSGLLAPATWILGTAVPDVAALRAPGGSGPAAVWLHLYALTAAWFVGFPRLLLAAWAARRCARESRSVPIDLGETYYRRILRDWRGARSTVFVVPYSFEPSAPAREGIRAALADLFGTRAAILWQPALSFGARVDAMTRRRALAEEAASATPSSGVAAHAEEHRCFVLLFNLAQTPELDVHGSLIHELKAHLDPERERLLLLVDAEPYRRRIDSPDRLRERRAAWARLARESGLRLAEVAASDDPQRDTLAELRAALWPPAEGGVKRAHGATEP